MVFLASHKIFRLFLVTAAKIWFGGLNWRFIGGSRCCSQCAIFARDADIGRVVSATERQFDCTFDEDDYCGYSDQSQGPVKWIRSKAHEHTSPGTPTDL